MAKNSSDASAFWGPRIGDDKGKKHSSTEPLFVNTSVDHAIDEDGLIVPDSGYQDFQSSERVHSMRNDTCIIVCLLCFIIATIGLAVGKIAYDMDQSNMTLFTPSSRTH